MASRHWISQKGRLKQSIITVLRELFLEIANPHRVVAINVNFIYNYAVTARGMDEKIIRNSYKDGGQHSRGICLILVCASYSGM